MSLLVVLSGVFGIIHSPTGTYHIWAVTGLHVPFDCNLSDVSKKFILTSIFRQICFCVLLNQGEVLVWPVWITVNHTVNMVSNPRSRVFKNTIYKQIFPRSSKY